MILNFLTSDKAMSHKDNLEIKKIPLIQKGHKILPLYSARNT